MEIEKMLKVNKTLEDELPYCSHDVAILTNDNPKLIMNDDAIYFGEIPTFTEFSSVKIQKLWKMF